MSENSMQVCIIGASGAIGNALLGRYLEDDRVETVVALCRQPPASSSDTRCHFLPIDLGSAGSIREAAESTAALGPLDRVIVASGFLHGRDSNGQERHPEKSLRDLNLDALQHSFLINSSGPAIVMQHFLPLLARRQRSVMALLSARVGSLSDNRLGGWYGYRASKAALNMLIRCAAIETGRSNRRAAVIGLHPGTVDSDLSAPFQSRLKPGQLRSPTTAAEALYRVIEQADVGDSGRCLAYDGSIIPP